jgi:Bacteriophage CI repressor helix-turn-helix domain.
MKNDFNFDDIIPRLKTAINVSNDADLAGRMGMKPNTFSNRKKSGSLPYEEIIRIADSENVNINWIFSGQGSMYRDQPTVNPEESLDQRNTALLTLFAALNEDQQREILAAAQEKDD